MPGPFRTLAVERIYESAYCALRRDRVRLPGGGEGLHHVIEIPDSAIVVPVLDDGRILLIRQFRYAPGLPLWEVPAGRVGPDETPAEAAARECEEEAGWRPRRIEGGALFYPLAGISNHRAYTFVGLGLVRSRTAHERTESIAVHAFAPDEVRRMIARGEIREAFSLVALARRFLAADAHLTAAREPGRARTPARRRGPNRSGSKGRKRASR